MQTKGLKKIRTREAYSRLAKNNNFRLLLFAQGISNMGDWLILGILLGFVEAKAGALTASFLLVAKLLPALIFSPLIGTLVDRVDRRKGMIFSDIARATLVVSLVFLLNLSNVWPVLLVIFLVELFNLFYVPAKDASIPNMVSKDLILNANSLSFTVNQLTMLIGLSFGTTIVLVVNKVSAKIPLLSEFLGSYTAIYLDALTFVASAAMLYFIAFPKAKKIPKGEFHSILNDIKSTFEFLGNYPKIRSIIISAGISIFGLGTIMAVGPNFSDKVLKIGSQGATSLLTFLALGLFAGATMVGRLSRHLVKEIIFSGSLFFLGLSLVIFAIVSNYFLAFALVVIAGFGLGTLYVSAYTMIHEYVDDIIRGRLITTLEADIRLAVIISAIVAGALTTILGNDLKITLGSFIYPLPGSRVVLILGGLIVIITSVFAFANIKHQTL